MAHLIPTRGPWEVKYTESDKTLRIIGPATDKGHRRVIAVVVGNDITAEANAAMLGAAPNLLKALRDLLDWYLRLANSGDAGFWNPEEEAQVIAARGAIRKAEVREDV